jgi:hypothetical protein
VATRRAPASPKGKIFGMDTTLRDRRERATALMRAGGLAPHFLALLFQRLPGPTSAVLAGMRPALEHVGGALLAEVERSQRAGEFEPSMFVLPLRLMAAPARSVPACAQRGMDDALINGGLHLRAVLLMPERLRAAAALQRRVREDPAIQRGARGKLRRVGVERVAPGAEAKAAALLLEGLEREPAFKDGLLTLP